MLKYFDKTFFRLLGGFTLIILVSLAVLIAIGIFDPFATPAAPYEAVR